MNGEVPSFKHWIRPRLFSHELIRRRVQKKVGILFLRVSLWEPAPRKERRAGRSSVAPDDAFWALLFEALSQLLEGGPSASLAASLRQMKKSVHSLISDRVSPRGGRVYLIESLEPVRRALPPVEMCCLEKR